MRQKEILEKKSNQNQNSQTMVDIIELLQEEFKKRGREEGIEKGKKIAVFDAWERGYEITLLSNVFSLSTDQVLAIIEEMKKEKG